MTSKQKPRNTMMEFGHTPAHTHASLPDSEAHSHGKDTMATYEVSGTKRKRRLKQMFWLSLVITALSVGAMVVGSLAMIENSEFPYIMNSAGLAGLACLISAILTICLVQMGRKANTFAELPSSFRSMFCCGIVTLGFTWFFIALALGLGGVWGTIDCVRTIRSHNLLHLCKGDAHKLFALSLVTLITMCFLAIFVLILHCMYCYSQRGLQSDMFILKEDSVEEMEVPHDRVKRLRDYCDPHTSAGRATPSSQDSHQDKHHRDHRLVNDYRAQNNHRIPPNDNDRSFKHVHDGYSYDHRRDNRHSRDYRYEHKDRDSTHRHEHGNDLDCDRSERNHHRNRNVQETGDYIRNHKESQSLKSAEHRSGHGDHFNEHRLEHDRHSFDQRSSYSERSCHYKHTHDDRTSQSQHRSRDHRHTTNHRDRNYRPSHDQYHKTKSDNRSHHSKRTFNSSLDERPPYYREVVRTTV